jgi:hypothetical protein
MLADMMVVLLGVIMLTVSNGTTEEGWVVMYGISQFVFGFGIGKFTPSAHQGGGFTPWKHTRASFKPDHKTLQLSDPTLITCLLTALDGDKVICRWDQVLLYFAGGEYPATSTRAVEEESEEDRERSQRHRGRKVMLVSPNDGYESGTRPAQLYQENLGAPTPLLTIRGV